MDEAVAKRTRASCKAAKEQPKLKSDEMIIIFKFLPTRDLVRFVSNIPKPLLGKFWNPALKFVVERRLPLSIHQQQGPSGVFTVRDSVGIKIADIKNPELFRNSPLCELVEKAELRLRLYVYNLTIYSRNARDVLLATRNVKQLCFVECFRNLLGPMARNPKYLYFNIDLIGNEMHGIFSQLEKFTIRNVPSQTPAFYLAAMVSLVRQMTNLSKLLVPGIIFKLLTPGQPYYSEAVGSAEDILGRLESLSILKLGDKSISMQQILHFVQTYCARLGDLSMRAVAGVEIERYFSTLRALPSVNNLLLDLSSIEPNGLMVSQNEGNVASIQKLRLVYDRLKQAQKLFGVIAKFPNVTTLSLQLTDLDLQFVSQLCGRKMLPKLQRLQLFSICETTDEFTSDDILALIKSLHLPDVLDLSQAAYRYSPQNETDFLLSLYRSMQVNSIGYLALRGPVHLEAIEKLQESFVDAMSDGSGSIITWRDSEFGFVPSSNPHRLTDYKIMGRKIGGPAKGEVFTVRICHRLKKRVDIFECVKAIKIFW